MRQIATWNPGRDLWETGTQDLFGHSDVYSETWPTSGMTRNGVAYALPTWEPPTDGSGSSSSEPAETRNLPTPTARDFKDHEIRREPHRPNETDTLSRALTVLLPTPTASEATGAGSGPAKTGGKNLRTVVSSLPTPTATVSSENRGQDLRQERQPRVETKKNSIILGVPLSTAVRLVTK